MASKTGEYAAGVQTDARSRDSEVSVWVDCFAPSTTLTSGLMGTANGWTDPSVSGIGGGALRQDVPERVEM